MSFEDGYVAFGPYACYGQAIATALAAVPVVKDMVLSQQVRRTELEASEGKLQQEKEQLEKRHVQLEKKAEGTFPRMQHLDANIKTTQATNAELNQRLQQALKNNEELEAKIQDLQKRCEATEKEHVSAEEPKDAGKAHIQVLNQSSKGFFAIHPVWEDVSECLEASDLRHVSFSTKHGMLRQFFKTQLARRRKKKQTAEKKEFDFHLAQAKAIIDASLARQRIG